MQTSDELINEVRTLESENEQLRRADRSHRIRIQKLSAELEATGDSLQRRIDSLQTAVSELESARPGSATDGTFRGSAGPAPATATTIGASARKSGVNVAFSPAAFYGANHHKDVRVVERLALANKSLAARDAIARGASNLSVDAPDILLLARASKAGLVAPEGLQAIRGWNTRNLCSLARVVADQRLRPTDQQDAIALYQLVLRTWGTDAFDTRAHRVYLELLDEVGDDEAFDHHAEQIALVSRDPVQRALLLANRRNRTSGTNGDWLTELNAEYERAGFNRVDVADGDGDLLGRLQVESAPVDQGPLVSVLMPTFQGRDYLLTAIRSVLHQTWRNIELIVVDDCSRDGSWEWLQERLPADPRLKLIRQESNQGAYRARLKAFSRATGTFVTVHDDDDWSHPQKIQTQVEHLLDGAGTVANMSCMVRIDQHGRFVRINDNPELNQKNYSSMMMRATDVERLGLWDDLNRAADAEFHDRVVALTGQTIQSLRTAPLSFMRARSGSLTSGEIRKGALDFGRQTYGHLYASWHDRIRSADTADEARTLPFLPTDRPFAIPANLRAGDRRPQFARFDVIYCTDMRFPGGNSSLTAAELRCLARAGYRVGVLQLNSPVLRRPRGTNPDLADVLLDEGITVLTLEDSAEADLVICRNPTVLQFADNLSTGIRAGRCAVVANTAPMSRDGKDSVYDLAVCRDHATSMFGVPADVHPESPQTRQLIVALYPGTPLSDTEWPGFIDDARIASEPRQPSGRLPVVGRHSRDHRLKWPDSATEVRDTYVCPEVFSTRILGGAASVRSTVDLEQLGVDVLPFGNVDPDMFLREIDFWVYQHSRDMVESFGMATLEALAAGCPVLLPPYMESLFGNAARYAEPHQVREIVSQLWKDPASYTSQSARALQTVRARFSSSAFVDRVRSLGANPSAQERGGRQA